MTYKKVTKPNARKMYNAGYEVKLLPCKVNSAVALDPSAQGHFWVHPVSIKKDSADHLIQYEDNTIRQCGTFDRTLNAYEYYNCCAELGYYAHYFVTQEDYDKWCASQFKEEPKNDA